MAARWDTRSATEQQRVQDAGLARQLLHALGPSSPYWRDTVYGAGIRVADIHGVRDLARVPAVGERDICPDGNPAGAAKLVIQAGEAEYALHSAGPRLRRSLARRLLAPTSYRRDVSNAVRPVTFHMGGLALRFPIASTRDDLDVIARAGARLWAVLGLTDSDVLVSALPSDGRLPAVALGYAALGAGAPAVFAGAAARESLDVLPATVVAVTDANALVGLLPLPDSVRTVVVTGDDSGVSGLVPGVTVLRVWGAPDGRWLYGECRQGGRAQGFHTYPDLEVLETIDPATTDLAVAGELVLTQLGVAGSALARWRTGAVHSGLLTQPCPACGRTVPRLPANLQPGALIATADVAGRSAHIDLRAVAGALGARADLAGWLLELTAAGPNRPALVVARVAPAATTRREQARAAVDAYSDITDVAGVAPSQVVLDASLAGRHEVRVGAGG